LVARIGPARPLVEERRLRRGSRPREPHCPGSRGVLAPRKGASPVRSARSGGLSRTRARPSFGGISGRRGMLIYWL